MDSAMVQTAIMLQHVIMDILALSIIQPPVTTVIVVPEILILGHRIALEHLILQPASQEHLIL